MRALFSVQRFASVLLLGALVQACSLQPPAENNPSAASTPSTASAPSAAPIAPNKTVTPQAATAQLPSARDIDWSSYEGKYPRDNTQTQPHNTALLQLPYIAEAIAQALPPQALAELATLHVEVPITRPAPDYLQVHLCEAHNCGHGVDLIFYTPSLRVTAVFYQPIENPPSMVIPCHSNQVTRVGELPDAVQDALRLRIIAEEDTSLDRAALGCYRRPLR